MAVTLVGYSPGVGALGYRHVQSVAASVWTVDHGLGYYPAGVTVEDSAGDDWIGFEVNHLDTSTLTISFGGPSFDGIAYVS